MMYNKSDYNKALDDVIDLIENMGCETTGWGFIVDEINDKLRLREDEI